MAASSRSSAATASLMFGLSFAANLAVSIVAPMLPSQLARRGLLPPGGLGDMVKGSLFAISSMTSLFVTPMHPMVQKKLGYIPEVTLGMLLFAFGMTGFGAADVFAAQLSGEPVSEPSTCPTLELTLMFIFRVTAAVGGNLASMSSMGLALAANPSNKGALVGAAETATGIGFSMGPAFGAAFYAQFGFPAPFAAASAVVVGLFPLVITAAKATMQEEAQESSQKATAATPGSSLSPWTSPAALIISFVGGSLGMGALGFLDPTLAQHGQDVLDATPSGVGVLFACLAMPYALLGTVVGAIADASPEMGPALLCGGTACLGLSLAGLAPLAPFMATWAWQIGMLLVASAAAACMVVPFLTVLDHILEHEASKRGKRCCDHDTLLSFGFVWFNLGELAGPLAGSYTVGVYGFNTSFHTMGSLVILLSLICALLMASGGHCKRRSKPGEGGAAQPMLPRSGSRLSEVAPVHHATPKNTFLLRACSASDLSEEPLE